MTESSAALLRLIYDSEQADPHHAQFHTGPIASALKEEGWDEGVTRGLMKGLEEKGHLRDVVLSDSGEVVKFGGLSASGAEVARSEPPRFDVTE